MCQIEFMCTLSIRCEIAHETACFEYADRIHTFKYPLRGEKNVEFPRRCEKPNRLESIGHKLVLFCRWNLNFNAQFGCVFFTLVATKANGVYVLENM